MLTLALPLPATSSCRDLEWSKLYNAVQEECRQRILMAESEMAMVRSQFAKAERERESVEGELAATRQRLERAEAAIEQARTMVAQWRRRGSV